MKPDLIITWIMHTDYPIFRQWMKRYRNFFGKVIVYWSLHNRFPYFNSFIQEAMRDDHINFLDPVETDWGHEDWRNKSTNEMLKHSNSEWVCSIEQDYFCRDWDKLLSGVVEASKTHDLIGHPGKPGSQPNQDYLKGEYIHPALWFMKREALEKTSKNFAAVPARGWDHFGVITEEAMKLGIKTVTLSDMGYEVETKPDAFSFHLGGVNQNYLESVNPAYVFHRPEPFYVYNHFCRQVTVPQSIDFLRLSEQVDKVLLSKYPELVSINCEDNPWTVFFK